VTKRWFILRLSIGIVSIVIVGLFIIVLQTPPLETTLKQLNDEGFTGAILVADGDTIIHSQGHAWASCDNDVPNTADTVFAIGSITKMFTAAAVGQSADQGRFSIDDSIGDYLALPVDKASITIRQLLNHTSGLQAYHETQDRGDFESMDQQGALTEIGRQELLFEPGHRFSYSNSGYTLLALLIEKASGQSYTDYLREHIFTPAGMRTTGFWGDAFDQMASTPNVILGCSSPDTWEHSWVLVGNGGMVSTVGDLHLWVIALQGDAILSDEAKAAIGLDKALRYGFSDAGGSSQHEFSASVAYVGPTQTVVVAISNRSVMVAEEITERILRSALRDRFLGRR
jgi:CubicO group peptidase (beta-lactamase class C family)